MPTDKSVNPKTGSNKGTCPMGIKEILGEKKTKSYKSPPSMALQAFVYSGPWPEAKPMKIVISIFS